MMIVQSDTASGTSNIIMSQDSAIVVWPGTPFDETSLLKLRRHLPVIGLNIGIDFVWSEVTILWFDRTVTGRNRDLTTDQQMVFLGVIR